jgi:exodeoxyribonuclease V beta subunit
VRPFDPLLPLPPGTTLVEASAGTGKTYNLTNLCLRLVVEHGVPVDRILLVTFTRAATAELRDRLRKRFVEAAAALAAAADGAPPPDEPVRRHLGWLGDAAHPDLEERRHRLARAVRDVDAAAVFTIHGFCQRVLREHALACGFDLTAELLEDTRAVVEDAVIDTHVALRHDKSTAELVFLDDAKLRLTDLRTLARAVTHDADAPIDPPGDYPALDDAIGGLAAAWARDGADAAAWVLARVADDTLNRTSYRPDRVEAQARALGAWLTGDGPIPASGFALLTPTMLASKVKKGRALPAAVPPILHQVEALHDALGPLADAASGAVARALRARYERALAQADAIGFDRLIRDVAAKVDEPALRHALRERYHAALIDEFQDTDAAQWRIFHTLFGRAPDRRLILVGDPKQAIYAFRGADVRVYGAAREATPDDRRFTMRTNHRSDGPLVAALNALFRPAARATGEPLDAFGEPFIRYEPVGVPAHHAAPRLSAPGRAPVELRWFSAEDFGGERGGPARSGDAIEALPARVRDEIRAILGSGATITTRDGTRPVAPGDLAVLVTTNRLAALVRDALARGGLPAVVQQGEPVVASEAAGWIADWLAAVASPTADAPLRRFAVSPLGGWALPDLYAALHQEDLAAQERWAALCERVAVQAAVFARRGFLATWHTLLANTSDGDPLGRVAATPRGERALTDLAHLAELLHAAAAERPGPAALGAWLRAQRDEPDLDADALAQRLETDARAVQIVTIHKSKGLQYPIVLLPDLWRGPSSAHLPTRITPYLHPTPDGAALRLDATVNPKAEPKRSRIAAADDAVRRERVRLLYVATTRAEHHLVVWGGPHKDFGRSPLAALLAAHVADVTDPVAEADALDVDLDALRGLLAGPIARGEVAITGLDGAASAAAPPGHDDAATPTPARYGRGGFDRAWRRLSFTGLTRTAGHGAPAEADYDEVDVGAAPEPTAPLADEVPLARFPRGREAGVYVHGIFEKIDFQTLLPRDGGDLAALLRADARRTGLDDEQALDELQAALPTIVATPLGGALGPFALRDLAPTDRLDELAFDLPVCGGFSWRAGGPGVTGAALAEALRGAGAGIPGYDAWLARVAALQPDAVAGFLTGSIDLVGRVHTAEGPRFFVADYKTNRLATPAPDDPVGRSTQADYAPDRLAAAMAEHHYFLQAALYLVALDRYLRHRLGARYAYERDVLGAAYLFVRGMSGAPGAGVLGFRPPASTIDALSALLERGAP